MRFPLFRDNWTKYRVSDLLETYPTNSLSWDQLSYDISKLKNIHYGLIHNGFETTCIDVKSDLIPYIKLAYYPKKYTLLKIGDLILADASEDREDVGKSIEIIEEVKQKTISGLHTIHARDKVNFIIKGFKGFYFKSKPMKEQIFKIANGSKIYGITSSNFNELYMCMPGKLEQEKIVSLMMKIEQRIQTQSKIIDLYTSLIKSIEDNIFWNNTDYHSLPIKKILTEIIEKSIIQNQYPILSSTKQGIFLQSEYFNKEAASSNNIGYKITHKGDIIISPQNLWMGNINYNDKFENGLVSPSYHIYQINKMFNPIYISEILKTRRALFMYKTISEQGASIVRRNLNIDAFSELYFPIPDRKKQDEISLIISKLHQKINIEKCLLDQYKNQKNYLLRNMFI